MVIKAAGQSVSVTEADSPLSQTSLSTELLCPGQSQPQGNTSQPVGPSQRVTGAGTKGS